VARSKNGYELGSGNVFADLELVAPDELLAKAELARQITSIATHRHLTQAQAARILGTTQPKVSDLFAGKLAGFSMERLMRFLNALDRDVRIVVCPKPRGRERATTTVTG
jgi:predicted XRE-type DNA-binding protein